MATPPRRPAAFVLCSAALLALSGCLDLECEALVRADGSCRVTLTAGVDAASGLLDRMALPIDPATLQQQRQRAVALARRNAEALVASHPGARLDSVSLTRDAPERVRTVIDFPDANALDLSRLILEAVDPEAIGTPGGPGGGDDGEFIRLEHRPGQVTVRTRLHRVFDRAAMEQLLSAESRRQIRAYLPLAGDGTLRVAVRVEGVSAGTNARHPNDDRTGAVVVDLPFTPMLEAALNRTADLNKAFDLDGEARDRALEALIPGFRIESADPLVLRYR